MRQAGEAGERIGRNKLRLVAKLHAADYGCEVDVAATFTGSQQRSLHLDCACKDRSSRVGDAKPAVSVAVKAELRVGKIVCETREDFCFDFFRAGAAVGVAK